MQKNIPQPQPAVKAGFDTTVRMLLLLNSERITNIYVLNDDDERPVLYCDIDHVTQSPKVISPADAALLDSDRYPKGLVQSMLAVKYHSEQLTNIRYVNPHNDSDGWQRERERQRRLKQQMLIYYYAVLMQSYNDDYEQYVEQLDEIKQKEINNLKIMAMKNKINTHLESYRQLWMQRMTEWRTSHFQYICDNYYKAHSEKSRLEQAIRQAKAENRKPDEIFEMEKQLDKCQRIIYDPAVIFMRQYGSSAEGARMYCNSTEMHDRQQLEKRIEQMAEMLADTGIDVEYTRCTGVSITENGVAMRVADNNRGADIALNLPDAHDPMQYPETNILVKEFVIRQQQGAANAKGNITDVNINQTGDGRNMLCCRIDGERQLSKKISNEDWNAFLSGKTDLARLADRYYATEVDLARNPGVTRSFGR